MKEKLLTLLLKGTTVTCLTSHYDYYELGLEYVIDTDQYGDFGIVDEDGDVMSEGCIIRDSRMRACFNPNRWSFDKVIAQIINEEFDEKTSIEKLNELLAEKYAKNETSSNTDKNRENIKDILLIEYPKDAVVVCLADGLEWYRQGSRYTIGYDSYGDYGVKDHDGHVMSEGCIISKNNKCLFNPNDWKLLLDDKPLLVKEAKELFPDGSLVRCVSNGNSKWYKVDRLYTVGLDESGDYGVKDDDGDVMDIGFICDESQGGTEATGFNPDNWRLAKPADAFVEAIRVIKDTYPEGTIFESKDNGFRAVVGYDIHGTYGLVPLSEFCGVKEVVLKGILIPNTTSTEYVLDDMLFNPQDWIEVGVSSIQEDGRKVMTILDKEEEGEEEEEHILYDLKNFDNIVVFSINYQSPKITSTDEPIGFVASNGIFIASFNNTQLCEKTVFIKGSEEEEDSGVSTLRFKTESEAKEYVDKVNEAFRELKESGYIMNYSNVLSWL